MTGSIGPRELGGTPDGAMPAECVDADGIIYTSGGFKNFGGEARLSGAVDLGNVGGGEITFSCLFVVKLDTPSNTAAASPAGSRRQGRGISVR